MDLKIVNAYIGLSVLAEFSDGREIRGILNDIDGDTVYIGNNSYPLHSLEQLNGLGSPVRYFIQHHNGTLVGPNEGAGEVDFKWERFRLDELPLTEGELF